MSEKTKTLTIVIVAIVAVAATAGLTYYLQQRRVDQLTAQLQAKQAELVALTARVDRINAMLQSQVESTTAQNESGSSTEQTDDTEPQARPEPTTSRQSAFVRKSTGKNGRISLVLDFAQLLTGDAAAEAAADEGDEPPPNDYYISNTNPKLRTFLVDKSAKFVVAYGDPNDTATLTAGEFHDAITENTDGAADALYWFVITNGKVTGGEQQWLP